MREIITNLPNEKKYCRMIASVVAQLSDGIWENSPRCTPYWWFAECDSSKNNINVSENFYNHSYNIKNPYYNMTDEQIKKYFARKLKEIVLIELEDNYERKIRNEIMGDLNTFMIPNHRIDEYREKYEIYKNYIKENPFSKKSKFNLDNDTELCYIGYGEGITVADCYRAYKILMK